MDATSERRPASGNGGWDRFWFTEIPPHIYALLRILFGLLSVVGLLGVRHLSVFWDVDGFVPLADRLGLKAFFVDLGLGAFGGRVIFFGSLACYASMAVGFRSGLSVTLSMAASVLQSSWNSLPLSGENTVAQAMLFCLVWADCGSVWSVDAWLKRRKRPKETHTSHRYPIAPLRLIRFQVALVYLSSGLWKLVNESWRDGSAVHYVLDNNVFQRFPHELPVGLDWLTTTLTYSVLLWELAFAFMILYRPTRRVALLVGVMMHLGMTGLIEVGLFPWAMLASYVAFLDPGRVAELPSLVRRFLGPRSDG